MTYYPNSPKAPDFSNFSDALRIFDVPSFWNFSKRSDSSGFPNLQPSQTPRTFQFSHMYERLRGSQKLCEVATAISVLSPAEHIFKKLGLGNMQRQCIQTDSMYSPRLSRNRPWYTSLESSESPDRLRSLKSPKYLEQRRSHKLQKSRGFQTPPQQFPELPDGLNQLGILKQLLTAFALQLNAVFVMSCGWGLT